MTTPSIARVLVKCECQCIINDALQDVYSHCFLSVSVGLGRFSQTTTRALLRRHKFSSQCTGHKLDTETIYVKILSNELIIFILIAMASDNQVIAR